MKTTASNDIDQVRTIAQACAREYGQENYGAPHLLKGLLHNEVGLTASLAMLGKDIHYLREWADLRIEQYPRSGKTLDSPLADDSVLKTMEVADMERLKLGQDIITPEAILAALCRPGVAFSEAQLKSFPLTEQEILRAYESDNQPIVSNGVSQVANGVTPSNKSNEGLTKYCVDKTQLARDGKLDPILGRDKEVRQMMEILSRRSKPNPIIVGEPGVGKTALVDGFALQVAAGKVPESLKESRLLELDSGAVIAGASYKGEIEDRLKKIIEGIKTEEKTILFIDEIHMLLDPNAGFGGAANLLKPELARGEITVIGATTNKEYREYIESDPAFGRRFDKIIVEEPDIRSAIHMVTHIAQKYEDHHGVQLGDDTVEETVRLAKRYIADKSLPDSAIDLLDNTMSAIKIAKESSAQLIDGFEANITSLRKTANLEDLQWIFGQFRHSLSPILSGTIDMENIPTTVESYKKYIAEVIAALREEIKIDTDTVLPSHIAAVVAGKTNIPMGKLQSDEKERLLTIEDHLRKRVVGQDTAIHTIGKAILESRAGLKKENKPVGSFFFTGPTGTGKTELAKSLAEFLFNDEKALIRFDMSEFKESVSAALLYGASPGYVGYKEGGLLVNKIREKPYSIVLFDEIEKAHPSVFDVFLQLLDEGRLTDKQGKEGDFSNAVILFTSNLGQQYIVDYHKEHSTLPASDWIREKYLNDPSITFRPEFLGRIDAIVPFAPISEEVVLLIFRIQLKDLVKRLHKQGIQFEISDEASKHLAFKGYHPEFGARPIREVIKSSLRQPLSLKIISGEIEEGDTVHVKLEQEEIVFDINKSAS